MYAAAVVCACAEMQSVNQSGSGASNATTTTTTTQDVMDDLYRDAVPVDPEVALQYRSLLDRIRPGYVHPDPRRQRRRRIQNNKKWSPYDRNEIMRSIHFYGYTGSLVEPPCTEMVEWRVMDTPMLISRGQLFQMKNLIFRHRTVENGCARTSNHHEGGAKRPIQRTVKRHRMYRCTCADFLSDAARDKDMNQTNSCSGDEEQMQLLETLARASGGMV